MTVTVLSFSYKHGLPVDETGNGGGFVFDCRALPNPYWDEYLRGFTGRDKPVADFFVNHREEVDAFLNAAKALVLQSIQGYLKDGRGYLQVAFGCTGGQHRSVYCAERFAESLRNLDGVSVKIIHSAQSHWRTQCLDAQNELDAVFERIAEMMPLSPDTRRRDVHLHELDVPIRWQNMLENIGIRTAWELVHTKKSELMKYRNLQGRHARLELAEIIDKALDALTGSSEEEP